MKLNLKKEINDILSNDKRSNEIKSKDEIQKILSVTLKGNEIEMNRGEWEKHIPMKNLLMGVRISGGCIIFSSSEFCVSSGFKKITNVFSIEDFNRVKVVRGGLLSDNIELDGKVIGKFNRRSIDPWNRIYNEINSILKTFFEKTLKERIEKDKILKDVVSKILPKENFIYDYPNFIIITSDKRFGIRITDQFEGEFKSLNESYRITYKIKGLLGGTKTRDLNPSLIEKILNGGTPIGEIISSSMVDETNFQNDDFQLLNKLYEIFNKYKEKILEYFKEQQRLKEEEKKLKEDKRLKELQVSQTNVLSELDKDGNGEVDVIEGNDFNLLLKKHQKSIVEVDRYYVQQFVKISSYLKTKEKNIQSVFNSIGDTPNQEVLNEYVEILKGDIHSYNLILFNSLNMIVSLVEDDMITFYEIHEMFDTLNMFDSKHEKDISQKLTNIEYGLENLIYEIRDMSDTINNSIGELSYVTEQSNQQLTDQLSEIDSTMKVGNLISVINTYQNYKINQNTKSLRG